MTSPTHDAILLAKINLDLKTAYEDEEAFWKQRSRQLWLSLGDKNTGYFHAATRGRNAINKFSVLEKEDGTAVYEDDHIAEVISSYYQSLFTSLNPDTKSVEDIVAEALTPRISETQNQALIRPPTAQEIKTAVFDIHPGKAPGPDGFSSCFFQSNWEAIGPAIVQEIQEFFSSGIMPQNLNETFVRLIPKVQGAKRVADYRPIALCNVYYKAISKLLTRRLQPLLPLLISETQSAFIPNRAISDNVLITHEVLHFLKTSNAKKHCSMAVKTDMSKAYDRVEWLFLKLVLQKLGFHATWIQWIMQCVTTVSYSYLVNGAPRGQVFPQRGIRQGDPLSPYLFILCGEVLSGLCKKAEISGWLPGLKVARGCPRINHLLFADDTMFFCKANLRACSALKTILRKYETASGQCINTQKSSVSFSRLTPQDQRSRVKQSLMIDKEGGTGKYLGLPEHFGRKKKDLFTSIVDRIRQRTLSWSSKFLSSAGKMTLLKSVLTAMPSYAMSCFQLPVSLCKRIQSTLTRFWWDSSPQKKNTCWVSWEKLTKSKQDGGLGFRDLRNFNTALLGKLAWRIIQQPECLLSRVLLGKYCHSVSFLDANCPGSASHGWRSILAGRDLLKTKLGWALGNGKSIRIWDDAWLSLDTKLQPMGPASLTQKDWCVADLFIRDTVDWDIEKIQATLPAFKSDILALKPSRLGAADKQVWLGHPSGIYSTKSGYHSANESVCRSPHPTSQEEINWKAEIWNVQTAPKVKMFLWKTLQGALPTGHQLLTRHIDVNEACCRCGEPETILHLLFTCRYARNIWNLAPFKSGFSCDDLESVRAGLLVVKQQLCLPPTGLGLCPLYPWICWNLWKSRNQKLFNDRCFSVEDTLAKAIKDAKEWQEAQTPTQRALSPTPSITNRYASPFTEATLVCKSDAAWRLDSKSAGLGWVFQNTNSEVLSLHSATCEAVSSPLVAESLACRAAIMDAIKKGVSRLRLELDCQTLVRTINSQSTLLEVHGILSDIVISISSFDSFSCQYIPRSENVMADNLAKQALSLYEPLF